jgi:hypothetical protein
MVTQRAGIKSFVTTATSVKNIGGGKMPSKSAKQARTMAAAAHSPKFAKKVGIPQKVAKDFNQADKGTGRIKPKRKE